MIDFDRDNPKGETSWAFRVFRLNMTESSNFYWSLIPLARKERYLIKTNKINKNKTPSQQYFHASGPDARRIPPTLSDWENSFNKFENWTRINILVSAISNFETYLANSVKISIESHPSILANLHFGFQGSIDGVAYLKKDYYFTKKFSESLEPIIKELTRGSWQSRVSSFNKIFPENNLNLASEISQLEKIRNLRNNAAHSFGRQIEEATNNRTLDNLTSERLSEKRLLGYLKLLYELARKIDKYLVNTHIGNYELIYYYHINYSHKYSTANHSKCVTEFKKEIVSEKGADSLSKEYISQMILYYNSL